MKHRLPLVLLGLALLFTTGLSGKKTSPSDVQQDAPPNVIIVFVDDLGWADVGANGSVFYETPHIDRLANEGMRFTNAYAAAAICSPSRAALQTGRYPARLGITDWIRASFQGDAWQPDSPIAEFVEDSTKRLFTPRNFPYLPHEEVTLAEMLGEAGYATAHIGKWHLGPQDWWPAAQGYDENDGGNDFGQPPSYFDPYENERVQGIPNLPPRHEGEYLTDREGDEAVDFIRRHQEEPFFLHLAHYAVHTPIQAKDSLTEKYEAKTKPDETEQTNAEYAAMVESVDDAVGEVLAVLDSLGIAEQTLILFTSDNGGLEPVTDNAPLRSGKGFPYEGGIRVPFIAYWPGQIEGGTTSEEPVMGIDVFPTLAEIAGQPLPDGRPIDGVSLAPVLLEGESLDRESLFWYFPHYRYDQVGPYAIVRSGDWKLIRFFDGEPYSVREAELYNLADDLSEENDLAEAQPEKVQELEAKLEAWLTDVGARRFETNPDFATSTSDQ